MLNNQFNKQVFRQLIKRVFPPVEMVVAYGSGVFQQANNNQPKMVDLLMVVDDCGEFHRKNMKINQNHYSGLSYYLGQPYIKMLNQHIFPIHFNSHIPVDNHTIKYGVLSRKTLYDDLTQWNLLTIAGRLHKPVRFIQFGLKNTEIFQQNLKQAVSCAIILINKPQFTEFELFCKITQLSYMGDMRFSFGLENTKKVENIVNGNIDGFRTLYRPIIDKYFKDVKCTDGMVVSMASRQTLLSMLPSSVRQVGSLDNSIAEINKKSSTWMGMYHMLSSSWLKNYKYSMEKHKKTKK